MRAVVLALLLLAAPARADDAALMARVDRLLARSPIIDGHNDWAWALRENYGEDWTKLDLRADSRKFPKPLQTDIGRLRQGHVGGQFWSVWIPPDLKGDVAIRTTLEQIDLVHRLVARYPDDLVFARTAADVRRIEKAGRIASLIGIEGGGQIGGSLAALRQFRALGAAYMTLTHTLTTDWADSATDAPAHGGLTPFGKAVVHEMNRIGMLVDLSHVAPSVMRDALGVSKAPVIFSHSSARALVDHPRDVDDDTLRALAANGGVVMVNFAPGYVSAKVARWNADAAAERARFNAPPYSGLYIGQPGRAAAALSLWKSAHPQPRATIADVADHVDHIAAVAGHDHVGIGGDLDGITDTPDGLDGVHAYPALLAELMRRGWSEADLAKLAAGNILRVLEAAERTAAAMAAEPPSSSTIAMDTQAH